MKLFSFSNSLQVYFHSISAGFHQKKKKTIKKIFGCCHKWEQYNLDILPRKMGTISVSCQDLIS